MRLIEDPASDRKDRLDMSPDQRRPRATKHVEQRLIHRCQGPIVEKREEPARRAVDQRVEAVLGNAGTQRIHHGPRVEHSAGKVCRRYSRMTAIVSSGWLMCGQWPVARNTRSVLPGSIQWR